MHWFDQLSRQLAAGPEMQTTRRGVLKGAGAAAVAAPLAAPFASPAAAYAKNSIKARQASSQCTNCLLGAYKEYKKDNKSIKKIFARYGRKPKLSAVQAAALTNYLAGNRRALIDDLNACRTGTPCAPPPPPPVTGTGGTTCPPGTGPCPGGGGAIVTCCYGGDACCVCANVTGGYICCAGVIGCTCC
jgi:hypothetical protein